MENSSLGIYSDSRRINNRFFITPLIEIKNNKKTHHDQIVGVYQKWSKQTIRIDIKTENIQTDYNEEIDDSPSQEIDLVSLNRDKIHINIIGKVLPLIDDQNPMNDSEYWAICHLKSYEKPFEYYNRILENQKQINEKIDEFVNNINSDNFQNSDKEKQLSGFEKSINKLNEMILDFQKSLKSVIDNSVVGLEGNCPIESQLQYRKKLKSMIFRRKKQNFQ